MEVTKKRQIRKDKSGRDKGFTLVEVMIAVAVLSIGILAVGSMQVSSVEGNSLAGNTTEAVTVAENTLERFIGLPYTHNDLIDNTADGAATLRNPLPPLPAVAIPDIIARPPEFPPFQQGNYTVCWNVADNLAVNNTKTINIIVAWRQGFEDKAVLLEYIRAQDDLFF